MGTLLSCYTFSFIKRVENMIFEFGTIFTPDILNLVLTLILHPKKERLKYL